MIQKLFERPLQPGDKISSYRVIQKLGMGSYGITYVGVEEHSNEQVVIKQLRKRKGGVHSFHREKELLKKLHHPAIPSFIDEVASKNQLFLIMEHKKGHTFEEEIFQNNRKYSENEAFYYLWKLLFIVKYFHGEGIVHRDLRIPNIIVDGESIYVIDFGLARLVEEKDDSVDQYELEKKLMRSVCFQSDFYALGHFVLFLLYSSFEPDGKERSWEEELQMSDNAKKIIRRLLMIDQPYKSADEIIYDVENNVLGGNEYVIL